MSIATKPIESTWVLSCLPKSEETLRGAMPLLEAFETGEGFDDYRSFMDAALACFVPEAREELRAHYEGKGKLLKELLPEATVARLDRRLAAMILEIAKLEPTAIGFMIQALRQEDGLIPKGGMIP